jgi:type IV pilus assembly protein PilE
MQTASHPIASRRHLGFTLIEVMITVAVIAILSAIALPSYRDYVLRGQLVDGTTLLSATQANMERHFQDNRTYAAVGTIYPPCDGNIAATARTNGNFVVTCAGADAPTGTTYTLRATGSGPVNGVVYTVTQANARSTPSMGSTGWSTPSPNTCWVSRKGQAC